MISLRKHIDDYQPDRVVPEVQPAASCPYVPEPVVAEFRAMLLAIGECAGRAVPNLDVELNREMTGFQKTLTVTSSVTSSLLATTSRQARNELSKWADCALSHHQDIQRELREVLSAVSAAADSVCKRDEKYAKEIGVLTGRLGTIAEETDLALLRASLVDCTRSLKSCVARMAEESKASVSQLTDQVKEYRVRFEEAQRESLTDPLTDLANRRAFEKHLESRIADRKPFYVIMIDLDKFKRVNDSFGHIAGDDLLKQFAAELKSQFAPSDMVARLGGDEFIVVMGGNAVDAGARVDRIRKWALGEYKIDTGERQVKTALNASLGVAEWDGGENALALLARADRQVYRAKQPGSRETSHVIR
jgi:diguanylate cyclase